MVLQAPLVLKVMPDQRVLMEPLVKMGPLELPALFPDQQDLLERLARQVPLVWQELKEI